MTTSRMYFQHCRLQMPTTGPKVHTPYVLRRE
jgi:hypothetical protein